MSISRGNLTCGGRARPCNQASGGGTAASFSETDGDEPLRAEATDEIVSKLYRLDIRRVDTMIFTLYIILRCSSCGKRKRDASADKTLTQGGELLYYEHVRSREPRVIVAGRDLL